jgi:hypothetical protein
METSVFLGWGWCLHKVGTIQNNVLVLQKFPMKLIKFPLHDLRNAVGAFKSTDPVFCEEINSSSCVKSILTQFFGKLTEEEKT